MTDIDSKYLNRQKHKKKLEPKFKRTVLPIDDNSKKIKTFKKVKKSKTNVLKPTPAKRNVKLTKKEEKLFGS